MIQRRPSVQNDIFLHNATPDFCNTISCQALGNSHFSVLKNSPIVFLPEDYLCAQKDIREMFSPKYMESFRHADSPELQEVLSVSHFPQHIYHSPRQTFDNKGKIAEHWDNLAAKAEPNPSGHTQIDGTMEVTDLDKTEENRKLVEDFLYDVMQGNNLDKTPDYFDGDTYIQHNTGIADGVSGLNEALAALAEQNIQMIYTTTHQVLAQGNFVLAVSEGTFGDKPTAYYDLWRVENGKIVEHWDVMETIADKSTWQNQNGKF